MHVLTVNSVNSLLNYLTDKLKRTPSADIIQKWITEEKLEVTDKKVYPEIKKIHRSAFIECLLCIMDYAIFCVLEKMGEMFRGLHSIIRAFHIHMKCRNKISISTNTLTEKALFVLGVALSLMGIW